MTAVCSSIGAARFLFTLRQQIFNTWPTLRATCLRRARPGLFAHNGNRHRRLSTSMNLQRETSSKSDDVETSNLKHFVKLSLLPYDITVDQIYDSLGNCRIKDGKRGIYIPGCAMSKCKRHAYVHLVNEDDMKNALEYNKRGSSFHVRESAYKTMAAEMRVMGQSPFDDCWVVLTNLPEYTNDLELRRLFVDNDVRMLYHPLYKKYRSLGFAYVKFADRQAVKLAMHCFRKIRDCYIGMFYTDKKKAGDAQRQRKDSVELVGKYPHYISPITGRYSFHSTESFQNHNELYVLLSNLPYKITADEIYKYLGGCAIEDILIPGCSIHYSLRAAYVQVKSSEDVEKAMKLNEGSDNLIRVTPSSGRHVNFFLKNLGISPVDDAWISIRGVPSTCPVNEFNNFFDGLEFGPGRVLFKDTTTLIPFDENMKSLKEVFLNENYRWVTAFVQLKNREMVEKLMEKSSWKLGGRYCEVDPCLRPLVLDSQKTVRTTKDVVPPKPHVKICGVVSDFQPPVTKLAVTKIFAPVVPKSIDFIHSTRALVTFASNKEAVQALSKASQLISDKVEDHGKDLVSQKVKDLSAEPKQIHPHEDSEKVHYKIEIMGILHKLPPNVSESDIAKIIAPVVPSSIKIVGASTEPECKAVVTFASNKAAVLALMRVSQLFATQSSLF